ncbi:hypothetical protein FFF34_015700 [Inquilinus sp. KBS0705]|nr:hypothetical protein FFF34_015700 [Inquilinus sp. KBS0705]
MKRILTIAVVLLIAACAKKVEVKQQIAPDKTDLVKPLKDLTCNNGTVISATESSVVFEWNRAANNDSYELTVTNLLTQKIIKQQATTTTATLTLQRNTPYSWYVTGKYNKTLALTQSDTWKFYNAGAGTVSYAPFPAEIIAPTFGQILSPASGKINLKWKGSAVDNNIVSYTVYFGPKSSPDVFRDQLTDQFINDVVVSKGTTYYWRIVTVDTNGNTSDSGIKNFFIK